jgi:hypothetical protein
MNGEHKITSSHRERAALVYLRQSSMAQVREHTESTRSQYALADKAAALGWPRTSIEVIDADLGISGKWGVPREGFTELVTRMCRGDAGAIFGIEITRQPRKRRTAAHAAVKRASCARRRPGPRQPAWSAAGTAEGAGSLGKSRYAAVRDALAAAARRRWSAAMLAPGRGQV